MSKNDLYAQLRDVLIETRRAKNLTQMEVAMRLGKPQSFVSKYESGERRLDVIEFMEICRALSTDPLSLIQGLAAKDGAGDGYHDLGSYE